MLGNRITVYMDSIGQEIPEYLVNFDFFIDIMKEYGFTLAMPPLHGKNSGIFNKESYSIEGGYGSFKNILDNVGDISKQDPRIQSYYSNALDMKQEENKELYKVSSFNNWFIFQKN